MNLNYENSFEVVSGNFNDAGKVSIDIKKILKDQGITGDVLRRAAVAIYEAEINILSYAKKGNIHVILTPDFLEINIDDEGPGIEDIDLAMQEGYSTADEEIRSMGFGAGMGLPNMRNCADNFEIYSEINKGTHLKILIILTDEFSIL